MDEGELVTTDEEDALEVPLDLLEDDGYNPYSFVVEKQQIFLREFSKRCNMSEAARIADVSRATVHEAREKSESFDKAFQICQEFAYDKLEAEAYERAKNGKVISEQYDEDGNVTQRRKKYSDKLMQELLRAHRPDKYQNKSERDIDITIQWADGSSPEPIEGNNSKGLESGD